MTATAIFSDLRWTAEQVWLPPLNKIYKLLQLKTVINPPVAEPGEDLQRHYTIFEEESGTAICNVIVPQQDVIAFREFQTAILRSRMPIR